MATPVVRADPRALLDEALHGRETDAGAAAGDDRDAVLMRPWGGTLSEYRVCSWEMKTFFSSVIDTGASGRGPAEAGLLVAAERRPVAHRAVEFTLRLPDSTAPARPRS